MNNANRHRTVGNVLDETGRRERQQAQRISDLEAQVTRLQNAYREALVEIDWWPDTWDTMTAKEQRFEHRANGLQPGDLDPVKGNDDE